MEARKPTPAQRDLILQALSPIRPEGTERIINTWRTPEITTKIMREQGWIRREPHINDPAKIRELQAEIVRLVSDARDQLSQSIDNWPAASVLLGQVKDISDRLSAHCYRVTVQGEKAVGWVPEQAATPLQ